MIKIERKNSDLSLRSPTIRDYDFYYHLKCEESNIYWSGHKDKPDYEAFRKWYIEKVILKEIDFLLILYKNSPIGALYYKYHKDTKVCEYLGLAITEKYQGRGLATDSVRIFFKHIKENYLECLKVWFLIREDNTISKRIHKKIGCYRNKKTRLLFLESDNKEVLMEEWEYVFTNEV